MTQNTCNYAIEADPALYTEQEVQKIREELETLRIDFNNYRALMQERKWNLQHILADTNRNLEIALKLHNLCVNSASFIEGYNNARVLEVLHLLTEDNLAKLKNLKESQD